MSSDRKFYTECMNPRVRPDRTGSHRSESRTIQPSSTCDGGKSRKDDYKLDGMGECIWDWEIFLVEGYVTGLYI